MVPAVVSFLLQKAATARTLNDQRHRLSSSCCVDLGAQSWPITRLVQGGCGHAKRNTDFVFVPNQINNIEINGFCAIGFDLYALTQEHEPPSSMQFCPNDAQLALGKLFGNQILFCFTQWNDPQHLVKSWQAMSRIPVPHKTNLQVEMALLSVYKFCKLVCSHYMCYGTQQEVPNSTKKCTSLTPGMMPVLCLADSLSGAELFLAVLDLKSSLYLFGSFRRKRQTLVWTMRRKNKEKGTLAENLPVLCCPSMLLA